MRKYLALVLTVILALGMIAGCGKGKGGAAESLLTDKSLTDILTAIYEEKKPEFPTMEMPTDLADEASVTYYTGLAGENAGKVKEVLASESAMGSQAYSLVLVRLNDSKDAETVAAAMKEGIDPRKWICVEADDIRVSASGDVVMLIMVSSEFAESITAEQVTEAFKNVAGGSLSVDLK